ncbi:adenylate cyclase associated N terminal-domain-containing protein [Phlyctochytrium arcticum]|nr:adenylate cyclase associated N terminal-domain-containing protein [Phlyctochytrium arcticum]
MSEPSLASLIKRLETATQRIEEVAARNTNVNQTTNANQNAGASVKAFEELVNGSGKAYLELSAVVGGVVGEQAQFVHNALQSQTHLLQTASTSKKPDQSILPTLLQPTQSALSSITDLREKNRASPYYNHLSTVSEGIPALGWVVVEPAPVPYVGEMRDSAQFWANRVIKEWREKDKVHGEWAKSFVNLLTELQGYVKTFHTTGLVWNPKGGDAAKATATSAAAPAAAGGPPPPPPPPVLDTSNAPQQTKNAAAPDTGALFSALNSGNLTSGLRKVDKSEMTHKNPELRAGSVVKTSQGPVTGGEKTTVTKVKAPPKLALEGNKWVVENFSNDPNIVIDKAEMRHVVYVYNCVGCTIQVKGKVNAVTLDSCKKTALVASTVLATIDTINCASIQIQITDKAPTVAIDKTDGVQLYLAHSSLETEILSAKSSEMNVMVQTLDKGEFVERPVAEQFKTVVRDGVLVTVPVEHKG